MSNIPQDIEALSSQQILSGIYFGFQLTEEHFNLTQQAMRRMIAVPCGRDRERLDSLEWTLSDI
jgi:hypothetical protein